MHTFCALLEWWFWRWELIDAKLARRERAQLATIDGRASVARSFGR